MGTLTKKEDPVKLFSQGRISENKFEKIHGGKNYGWRPRKSRIRFYEYRGRVIWGLTAKMKESYVKR